MPTPTPGAKAATGTMGGSGRTSREGRERDRGDRAATPLGWFKNTMSMLMGGGNQAGGGGPGGSGSLSAPLSQSPVPATNNNSNFNNANTTPDASPAAGMSTGSGSRALPHPNHSNSKTMSVMRSNSRLNTVPPGSNSAASSRAPSPSPWTSFSLSLNRSSNNNNNSGNRLPRSRDPSADGDRDGERDRDIHRDDHDADYERGRFRAASPMLKQPNLKITSAPTLQRTGPAARSASPVPSVSSTLAAERLVRLTDAQLAELAAQVTAEAYRRRTPIGALLATYERASASSQVRANKPPTTSARIAIMTNEKFKIFAADLDLEASRRQIPGIDIMGTAAIASAPTAGGNGKLGLSTSNSSQNLSTTPASMSPPTHSSLNRNTADSHATRFDPQLTSTTTTVGTSGTTTPPPSPTRAPSSLQMDPSGLPARLLPILQNAAVTETQGTNHNSVATTHSGSSSNAATLGKPASASSLQQQQYLQLQQHSDKSVMRAEDLAVVRDRMSTLGDDEMRVLVRDVKAELEVREEALDRSLQKLHKQSAASDAKEEDGGAAAGGVLSSSSDDHAGEVDADAAALLDVAVAAEATAVPASSSGGGGAGGSGNGRFGSLGRLGRGEASPMRGAPGVTQRRLIPAKVGEVGGVANGGTAATAVQGERMSLLKGIASADLARLWEDVLNEVEKREASGVCILGVEITATGAIAVSPAVVVGACATAGGVGVAGAVADVIPGGVSSAEAVVLEAEEPVMEVVVESTKPKRKLPKGENGGGDDAKKEPDNVVAWRNRISKLSNDQLAEVTADVFDEITRRKEKEDAFLPPREDLSSKRNDARKELAKLPSKELKTLWTIIHDNMTKRNML
ncbi:hypothetical protein CcCBS67573_g05112 [Chytriomyces confervae]|uniref:Uncharacterized protein n=1 Tax=Chytriomyces confervae TaxID=246404 RepID=A0A507FDG1_9FUNG|nr:hypothetical protein CcCBS67573_g05112 [Chytriomyces confervae]